MKRILIGIAGILSLLIIQPLAVSAQGTAFTYQGRLNADGSPANGTFNLTFSLYTTNSGGTAVAGPVTNSAVAVADGLFTVALDFGADVWNGQTNWLEIGVQTNGAAAFTTITPRQELTPTPYAIRSESIFGLVVQSNTNGAPNLIGGSSLNYVATNVIGATIGGGGNNSVSGFYATIGGGSYNSALADLSVVGGGTNNMSDGYAATVPGGANNVASGADSLAAGASAQATNDNSFVWSDGSTNTISTTNNEFVARAGNGFVFYTSTNTLTGVVLAAGATSWATLSDRNAKNDFAPVNGEAILDKLAGVPIELWHYKWEKDSDVPNIGPMAQDFIHAFYPGRNDKSITTLEFDGVELAAIQGLNQKLQAQQAENAQLKQELDDLKAQLQLLERRTRPNQ
ncbi:MAG: tail fiber domain-containing protein [Limisphaerales bacterium]